MRKQQTGFINKGKRRFLLALEIICIIVAIICGFIVYQQLSGYWAADNDFKQITQTYERDIPRLETDNPNCVGWVSIAGTRIDYPVMYTPNDPEYYLHRNFEGDYSASGTPFLGDGCKPNGNSIIIYGHHMNDGSMFAQLLEFESPEFGLSHTIEYKTKEGIFSYRPFACFHEDLTSPNYYPYWDYVGYLDEQRFNEFISKVRSKTLYDFNTPVTYGDDLLMLSTCSYGTNDERFVVVAVYTHQ